jgi:hypothetical protein
VPGSADSDRCSPAKAGMKKVNGRLDEALPSTHREEAWYRLCNLV